MSRVIIEDEGWKAIMADPALSRARSKLSFHEIRLIVRHARAASAIETEGHDHEDGHGAEHESPTAATGGGDAHTPPPINYGRTA